MRKILILIIFAALFLGVLGFATWLNPSNEPLHISNITHLPLPQGEASSGTVRFAAFGDMGTGDQTQYAVARQMSSFKDARPFDTVLMLGDNIYPDGNPADFPAKFERPYAELLKNGVNFYAVLGNHDVRRGREAETNYPLFNMGGRAFYSFIKGDGLVEFFAVDSTNFDAVQAQWLETALAASRAQWKIAFFHHPIYSSASTHGSDTKLRARLEPALVKYGVNAAFSGHDHTYERVKLQRGVQYFVAGTGGKLRKRDLDRRSILMAAGSDETNGFMFVELNKEELCFWYVDASGRVIDSGKMPARAADPGSYTPYPNSPSR